MIQFLLTCGHDYTLKSVVKLSMSAKVRLMTYDEGFRARWLRQATYIFADLDRLGYGDLELAARLYVQLKNVGVRVLNNPALVKKRYALLRALYQAGLNDFNAYAVEELPASFHFPVFLRKPQGHSGPLSPLLHTREEVDEAIDRAISTGLPLENLILIEYAAEPLGKGLFRKLSAFKIGTEIIPHTSVHDRDWLVKEGRKGVAAEEHYEEELRMIQTNPYAGYLRKVFDIAGIDYGRVDFSICQGRIQVYEINTNAHVYAPYPHPSATRMKNLQLVWDKYLATLKTIDSPPGGLVKFTNRDTKVKSHRTWRSLLTHTRPVE